MPHKTRKQLGHINAKKGTQLKCKLKTCRAKMYKSVYGAASGGSIRNPKIIFI